MKLLGKKDGKSSFDMNTIGNAIIGMNFLISLAGIIFIASKFGFLVGMFLILPVFYAHGKFLVDAGKATQKWVEENSAKIGQGDRKG